MKSLIRFIIIVFLSVTNTQLLFAQNDPGEALKILSNGNVGIGTSNPSATLEVNGTFNAKSATFTDKVGIGTTIPGATLDVNGTFKAKSAIFSDIIGIGTNPLKALDVSGIGGIRISRSEGLSIDNEIYFQDNGQIRSLDNNHRLIFDRTNNIMELREFGNIILSPGSTDGTRTQKVMFKSNGNVGIGTENPNARLEVAGDIKASSINGEEPPMIFEVGNKTITNKWQATNVDIGPLCGDADGCTIKIFLRVVSNRDEVKTISEQIYIEQPDKSNNKTAGLSGYTYELGGGQKAFVLQTAALNDIIPNPWNWIFVRNYGSPEVGSQTAAYNGYNVQFMTRPEITATVIIYDR